MSIVMVVLVILGGLGSTVGVVIAAIALTILPEWLRALSDYRMIIYSLLLVILMIVRPQGLLGPDTLQRLRKRRKPQVVAPIEANA
jgi:branched-chain amino acid transport system permease protein